MSAARIQGKSRECSACRRRPQIHTPGIFCVSKPATVRLVALHNCLRLPARKAVQFWQNCCFTPHDKRFAMKFSIELGDNEKHTFEFKFNQLLGRSVVKVNDHEVFRKERWFSEPLVDSYAFEVGQFEPVRGRIEKKRQLLFASKYFLYVNNRLTQLYQGV
jgi:hypothetical protein